ncbi:DUF6286 domain-containing protein [Glutamicibacter sp. NPDC087344]|uniref:DUF6286 domain-containing protein n=1 Tax=Glutamicibacter sp. NPDC087344 TaxID=3363994 RepID=UPI00381B588E
MSRFWHVRSARTATLLTSSLVLLGVSITALVVCLIRLTSGAWPTWLAGALDDIKNIAWSDSRVLGSAVGVSILGLLLLVAALSPGNRKTTLLDWDSLDSREEWVIENRGLARLARHEAQRTDGVHDASPVLRGKRMHISISTPVHEASSISKSVQRNVQTALESIPLVQNFSVETHTNSRGGQ